jgi:hypothetical protein
MIKPFVLLQMDSLPVRTAGQHEYPSIAPRRQDGRLHLQAQHRIDKDLLHRFFVTKTYCTHILSF